MRVPIKRLGLTPQGGVKITGSVPERKNFSKVAGRSLSPARFDDYIGKKLRLTDGQLVPYDGLQLETT